MEIALIIGGLLAGAGGALCIYWYVYWERNFNGELLTEGPYEYVRHPYYAGFLLTSIGLVIALPAVETRILAVMTLAGMYVIVPREEQELINQYKKKYRKYMAKVKYRLIPGIY
jgi:protein-S-isoprenylcysteine O-methyltransferase Ste14